MISPSDSQLYRVSAAAAILGVLFIIVRQTTEIIHPQGDSGNSVVVFADYAAFDYWVLGHLLEFLAWAFVFAALVVLSWYLHTGRAAGWGVLGAAGAVTSLSLLGALQAVDGVALKVMVDRWVAAPAESQELLFESAYAVRQIEGSLLAMSLFVAGLTVLLYGIALYMDEAAPNWLGILGLLGGLLTVVAGVDTAYDPFGETTIRLGFLSMVALVWIIFVARFLFQISHRQSSHPLEVRNPDNRLD